MLDTSVQQRRRLFLISLATVGAALMLVITAMSATIRLSNAGLGCPDWPNCYGPRPHLSEASAGRERPDGGVIMTARLVHRIAATAVLVVIVAIGFACFGTRPVLWREGTVALALAALALFLAVLGRWTTGARLPAVALGNLLGGFAMLALFWWLRLRCAIAREPAAGADAPLRAGLVIAIGVLVLQIALGGLVSASFSALGCTTLPDCGGRAWAEAASLDAFDPWRDPLAQGWAPGSSTAVAVHMAHRYGALVAAIAIAVAALSALRAGPRQRRAGAVVLIVLACQLALGAAAVVWSLPLPVVLAHNVTAALLLLALLWLICVLRVR